MTSSTVSLSGWYEFPLNSGSQTYVNDDYIKLMLQHGSIARLVQMDFGSNTFGYGTPWDVWGALTPDQQIQFAAYKPTSEVSGYPAAYAASHPSEVSVPLPSTAIPASDQVQAVVSTLANLTSATPTATTSSTGFGLSGIVDWFSNNIFWIIIAVAVFFVLEAFFSQPVAGSARRRARYAN